MGDDGHGRRRSKEPRKEKKNRKEKGRRGVPYVEEGLALSGKDENPRCAYCFFPVAKAIVKRKGRDAE